jgi:serine/threonine protein kinase
MGLVYHNGMLLDRRYELVRHIDSGGMADVFEAWDQRMQRTVAVKVLQPAYAADADFCERFLQEAYAIGELPHRHIVAIHDYGCEGTHHYMVMEYLPGGNASQVLARAGPLPVERAIAIGAQIADGLSAAHQRGIVHRDVKPANILFTGDDCPKLADFGIARRMHSSGKTTPGTFFGTPEYIAPEIIRHQPASPAADVYSLGATLYELLTGTPPFSSETTEALLLQHLSTKPRPPSELVSNIPEALDAIICRTLEKDPAARYPDAAAFAEALRSLNLKPTHRKHVPKRGFRLALMMLVIVAGFLVILLQSKPVVTPMPLPDSPGSSTVTLVLPACSMPANGSYELPGSDYDRVVVCLPVEAELVDAFDLDRRICLWPGDHIEIRRSLELWAFRGAYWYQVRVHRLAQGSSRPSTCAAVNAEGWVSVTTIDTLIQIRP